MQPGDARRRGSRSQPRPRRQWGSSSGPPGPQFGAVLPQLRDQLAEQGDRAAQLEVARQLLIQAAAARTREDNRIKRENTFVIDGKRKVETSEEVKQEVEHEGST